ncbi:DPP10 peptidase, partial [Amia calva]|nr:DPP10 peptidase [Amia calva]
VFQIFRHSFSASYSIYNLHTGEVWELNPPEVPDSVLQFASWGIQKQQLVYIFENNIYYKKEVQSSALRLTSSGKEGVVFNGIADWLYEEELLQSHVAHWWSPNGEKLAFLMINDSLVPSMVLPRFTGELYPKGRQYPYPKAGQVNPSVKLYVANLNGIQTVEMMPPDSFQNSDYYIAMVKWINNEMLSVRWLNRSQTTALLTVCETVNGTCVKKHEMTSDIWLDRQNEQPVFSGDGSKFFLTVPIKHGGRGSFRHIAMFSDQVKIHTMLYGSGKHLTSGNWEVTRIQAFDETQNVVCLYVFFVYSYFLSTEKDSTQRQLYRVSAAEPFDHKCLTCDLLKGCTFYSVDFSPSMQHILLSCRGPDVPIITIHPICNVNGKYHTLENNTVLKEARSCKKVLGKEIRFVNINDYALPMQLTLPAGFAENNLYPLLLIVDGAPGSQSVNDKFLMDWDSVLVSADDVIVARFDGRGCGFQGQMILQQVHRRLGKYEVEDQISAVQLLIKLPYVDRSRIGVYGKAYGGFVTSLLLLSPDTYFKCGLAVAPVTNWTLYGSAFTERYLGFPLKDSRTYQACSILKNVSGSTHHKFLIVHGTADSNVHFQHSAELVKHLAQSNVNYTLQIYPDEGHDFASTENRYYLYRTVISFFRECFHEEAPITPEVKDED